MNRPTRVVVVDDEAAILVAIGALLSQDGYEVATYGSPTAAFEACVRRPPAFLVTDLQMSAMSGAELATSLRIELGPRSPKIVCVTGWITALRPAQRQMFDRVIERPFAYGDLLQILEELGAPSVRKPSGVRLRVPWLSRAEEPDEAAG